MKTVRSVDKFGWKSFVSAISLLYKNLKEYIRADFLPSNQLVNSKSTGLFAPGLALGGGGFTPLSVKLDPDILES